MTRFVISPLEQDTPLKYYHCNTKREWQTYLHGYFDHKLSLSEIGFDKTISNASFRLSGLEVKVGLLLGDHEQSQLNKNLISGAVRPSIVIDCVLSIYSILEGLGPLAHIANTPAPYRNSIINADSRADKIAKGIKSVTGLTWNKNLNALRDLRDRCIHQDVADRKDDKDYMHVFQIDRIVPHLTMIHSFLSALGTEENIMLETNLSDFFTHTRLPY